VWIRKLSSVFAPFLRNFHCLLCLTRIFTSEHKILTGLESMHLLSFGVVVDQHHSWATFWGGDPGMGPITLKFELGLDFLTMHLSTKFHRPMFNRSEVIMLTNKQTKRFCWKRSVIHLAPLCYAGGKSTPGYLYQCNVVILVHLYSTNNTVDCRWAQAEWRWKWLPVGET